MSHYTMRMGQGPVQLCCPMQDQLTTMTGMGMVMDTTLIRIILSMTVITMTRIRTIISFAFSSPRRILPLVRRPWSALRA